MNLTFQVLYSLQHRTLLLSPVTSTTGCYFCFGSIPSFFLELYLHWSPVAYWAPNDLGSSSTVSYLFAFSYCSQGSQGKNTEVVCHSLLQWTTFCQTSPPWPIPLGWPHTAWLSFIELDKAVVHVIRLASFLWLWFQSVCPLMPSLIAYHLTWVSLTWNVGYLFHGCSTKMRPLFLTLDVRLSPHGCCSWPWMWSSASCRSCTEQQPFTAIEQEKL